MKSMNAQRGMSYWSVMFGIVLLILVVKTATTTWPVYWDNQLINQMITERLKSAPDNTSPEEFKKGMVEQFGMNNIHNLEFKNIARVTLDNGLIVETDYEVREPFIANVDLVMSFKKRFDQKAIKSGE